MSELLGARRIRELLHQRGIHLTKSLGQNFVIDPNTIRKMVQVSGVQPGDRVLEIGAGAGSLTLGLIETGAEVTALEIDARLLPILEEVLADTSTRIVHADALRVDLGSFEPAAVVANLPYNVAATVVLEALETCPTAKTLTVMTQREVAERLAAEPGSRIYGKTSVMVAFYGAATVVAKVSRNAFYPVPNVDSSIVRITRRTVPGVDAQVFKRVVKAAFAQRRKSVRNGLAGVFGSATRAEERLRSVDVDPAARPESLSLDDMVRIASVADG